MMSRMGAWLDDWRVLVAVYIAGSGVWGILAKIASARLGARTVSFVALTTAAIVVAIATLGRLRWSSGGGLVAATGAGFLGGVASLALYGALRDGPASVIVPLSSLYLVVTVILSYVLLAETMGLRQTVAVDFGLLAVLLLSA